MSLRGLAPRTQLNVPAPGPTNTLHYTSGETCDPHPIDGPLPLEHTRRMKEYFPILSRYNSLANGEMIEILAGLEPERISEEVGSYFKSIYGILSHLYNSDIAWLQRIRKSVPGLASLENSALDVTVPWPTGTLFDTFEEYRGKRAALDQIFVQMTAELGDDALGAVIDYTNFRGQRQRYLCWQALMHVFNHQTHHRGQIAEILDQFGVANDFSNISRTLEQPPVE